MGKIRETPVHFSSNNRFHNFQFAVRRFAIYKTMPAIARFVPSFQELMCLPPLRKQRPSAESSQLFFALSFFALYCGWYFYEPSDRNLS